MATLKRASSAGPPAARRDRATRRRRRPRPPTGCERRNHSATNATAPSARSTASASPLWSAHVAARTSALSPAATAYIARSTTQSRAERRPSAPPRSSPGSSMRCQRGSVAWLVGRGRSWSRQRTHGAGRRPPTKVDASDRPPAVVARARDADPAGHDRLRRPHQALRRAHRRRGRLLPLRARHRHRLPRPQRRRQDDDACACSAGSRTPTPAGRPCSAATTATCPTRAAASGVLLDASAQHAGRRGRETLAVSAQTMGVDRAARRRAARRSSGSTARRRASACASTRWACASGSASRTRCSATPRS